MTIEVIAFSEASFRKDLDYPNGMGSADNMVRNLFWVANIPGDWMAINETVTELSEAVVSGEPDVLNYI